MEKCIAEYTSDELYQQTGKVAVTTLDRNICRALFEMREPAPFCPLTDEQRKSCPLVKALKREIPVREGIQQFNDLRLNK